MTPIMEVGLTPKSTENGAMVTTKIGRSSSQTTPTLLQIKSSTRPESWAKTSVSSSMSTSRVINWADMYEMSDPLGTRALRVGVSDAWLGRTWELFVGRTSPNQPVVFHAYMGRQPMDILWSSIVHLFCVSERVINLLKHHGATGWGTYPAEVYDRDGRLLPGYHGFSITGPNVKHDESRSEIVQKEIPWRPGKHYTVRKGFYFNEADWDGSDFFRSTGFKLVTKRVRDLLNKERIRNVCLTPLPEVELSVPSK